MAKKKAIKKLSVTASFFSMHRHARWLLIVFFLVSLVFVIVSHEADVKQETEIDHLLLQATNETVSWKTYMNPVGKFRIQYPANWKLNESHETSNREVADPKEVNTATLSGRNGEVVLQWGPMGFGGGCNEEDHTSLQLKQMTLPICKTRTDGKIEWSEIYSPHHEPAFGARATAEDTETENVITNIFATLSFTK